MTKRPTYDELLRTNKDLEAIIKDYQTFLDKNPDLFYRTDSEGKITYVSPSVFKISGYTAQEAIGMKMAEEIYLSPEEREIFLTKLLDSGQVSNFEAQMKRKDGSIWWASTSAHFYKDQDGNILGVEGVTRDISKLKETEKSLRNREQQFRLAFHTSPDSINLNRVSDGMYIDINQGFTDLTGYTHEDIVGKTSLEINIWSDPADREKLVHGLKKKGVVKNLEASFLKKNGEIGVGLMSARIMNFNDENVILSVTREITDRKLEKKALLESEKQLRLITDNMADVISQIDSKMEVIYTSPSIERVFGYHPQELIGKPGLDLIHPDDIESLLLNAAEARQNNSKSILLKYRYRHADGKYLWVESNIRLLYDEQGNSKGSIFGTRDISDRIQIENEKQKLHDKLIQAQKMEAIGTLAGGIAHDFNNILTGIFGFSQLAISNLDDPKKAEEKILQVINGAKRAAELVQQILTFSRQSEYRKNPLKIYLEIKESLKLLRSSIPSSIDIKTNIISKEKVMADPTKIHQIIMNLCTNAYHAMSHTGGILSVSLTDTEVSENSHIGNIPNGKYIRLEVSDTGHGMDKKTLKKVFDPYYTTKKMGEGTGLGLALVKAIVEEHNGFLKVNSEPDKGTSFLIFFPVTEEKIKPGFSTPRQDTPVVPNKTIIFVDDEEIIRLMCQELLKSYGYQVKSFDNGLKALAAFKKNPDQVDLIITDMTMPELTGYELAKKVLEVKPELPIILCTGYSENISEALALELGIRKYMQKPIENQELLSAVHNVLDDS